MKRSDRSKVGNAVRLVIVVSMLVTVGAFTSRPAAAHADCKYPSYPGAAVTDVGCVMNSHYTMTVGDNNCDGRAVYNIFYVRDTADSYVLEDPNGCQPGTGSWNLISPATRWMVCTSGIDCTPMTTA